MAIEFGLISKKHASAFLPLLPEEHRASFTQKGIYAIGAVKDKIACGILIFRSNELIANIQYLSVAESYRRQGIATGLLDFLCETAWQTGTAVLCSFSAENRDDPICRLLTRRGDFTLAETDDYICRFPCKALAKVPLNAAPPAGSRIEPFYKLPEDMQHRFFSYLREDNAEFSLWLQEDQDQMLSPLCLCITESGNVQAALFCREQSGNVFLSFAYARPGSAAGLIALVSQLRELLAKAAHKVPYLYIAAVTPESRKLIETLLPQREITGRFYTACWDMNTMGG